MRSPVEGVGAAIKQKPLVEGCDTTDDRGIRIERVAAVSPFQLALLRVMKSEAANETHPHLKVANGCGSRHPAIVSFVCPVELGLDRLGDPLLCPS
jgi:hypothetical protein